MINTQNNLAVEDTGADVPLGGLPSGAYQYATGVGGMGLDKMYENINNFLATTTDPTAIAAAQQEYGISDADIAAAKARTVKPINTVSGLTNVDTAPSNVAADTANVANTTGGLPTEKGPILIDSSGKQYSGDTLLKLAQQLGATTTAADLAGSAYGVKNGNIGFDYTEANKLFGNSNATQQVFLDAARGLIDQGITDLSQITAKDVKGSGNVFTSEDGKTYVTYADPNNAENSIQRELTPEELSRVKTTDIEAQGESSPATQQKILEDISIGRAIVGPDGKVYSPNDSMSLGTTYTGPGGTSYTLTYDAQGKPKFTTTGFSTSDADMIGPLASAVSLAFPAAAPFIQAGMAAYNLSQGNYTGAILGGLGAAGGFANADIANIDALANAGDYAGAVNAWENSPLAQNVGNINLAKTTVGGIDALSKGNIPGVINAGMSGLNQVGVTLPSGVTTAVQLVNLTTALSSGNTPAALNAVGDLTGSSNPKIAASALNVLNLMQNPNADPTALINSMSGLANAVKTYQPTTTTSGLTDTKVADTGDVSDSDVNSLIGDFSNKFAGIQDNPTTQVAGPLDQMPGQKPSWMTLDKGEKIIGKDEEVGTGDKATYLVQIDNPDDPEKPFIYQTYFDPRTGQQMYAPYGSMKTGGENIGDDVLVQSLAFRPTKPIPDWTPSDAEKGLPSTVKLTDETFNKTGTVGGLPTSADLQSVLKANVAGAKSDVTDAKSDVTGAKTDSTASSTTDGAGGEASNSTVVGGLGGGDAGTTGDKGVKNTTGAGTLTTLATDTTGKDGKAGTLTTLAGDNTSSTDGAKTTASTDGSKVTTSTDGTKVTNNTDGSTVTNNTDGSKVIVNTDGSTITNNTDGSKVTTNTDGTVVTNNTDGSVVTNNTDGTVVTNNTDGAVVTNNTDGTVVTNNTDGSTVTVNTDGTVVTQNTDGTKTTLITNDDNTTTTVVVDDTGKIETHDCGKGYHWDEASQSCVPDEQEEIVDTDRSVVTPTTPITPVTRLTPTVTTPRVTTPTTVTSPLSSGVGMAIPKLDSSEQLLKGAPAQKRMQLAKLQQLFASLTPEMAAVLSERGFEPPRYKEDVADAPSELQDSSIFGNLSDGLYNPKFMASGGTVFDSMMPKFIETPKHIAAAPVVGTGGVDSPLKLAALKHLYQSVGKPMKPLGELAKGGLPQKYAEAAPKGHKPEFITGLTGYYASGNGTGQSDDIPAMLHDGDYVIDADAVAALGDGSSKAGAEALSQFQSKVPHKMSSGGQAVPAKIADGEYVFPEAFVTAIGGGDNKHGAKRLDAMREELRAHKRSAPTSKIPPKAKSPLDYLRMAKG